MNTILYVEDDDHDVFFLKRALANDGRPWKLQNVHSVEEAINYLKGSEPYLDRAEFPPPDLVVSDVSIPGGSGYQLLDWVREHTELGRLPFILLTGSAQEPQMERASKCGADCCLEKSTDFRQLLAKIEKLLK